MKNVLIPLFAFVLGFVGVAGYQYFRNQPQSPATSPVESQPTPQPTFALVPPSQAVSGTLTVTGGHVLKYSRNDVEYKEASTGAQILLGESVATNEDSTATVEVSGIVKANFSPVAELVFANLFPTNFVLQQTIGKIEYAVSKPISVRALHALVAIDPGDVTINIIDTDMSVTVKTGSIKVALVDNDNNTKVWSLESGERANIDDTARTVFLVQPR